jgi:hypothetical protein
VKGQSSRLPLLQGNLLKKPRKERKKPDSSPRISRQINGLLINSAVPGSSGIKSAKQGNFSAEQANSSGIAARDGKLATVVFSVYSGQQIG